MKIGDYVKITNTWERFPNYSDWVADNCPQYLEMFDKLAPLKYGDVGEVVCIEPHEYFTELRLYGIVKDNVIFVMEEGGIEVVKSVPLSPSISSHGIRFCPSCNGSLWQIEDECNYCFRCGQAIKKEENK